MSEQQQDLETPADTSQPAGSQPADDQSPPVELTPDAKPALPAKQEKPAKSERARKAEAEDRQIFFRPPRRDPKEVAGYFIACPRCSFFVASYRLVYPDFDEAAANASGDWVDLSWNLAVRNLIAKNYGYELAQPLDYFQGICPDCRRAFSFQAGDSEEIPDRFSMQINPRT